MTFVELLIAAAILSIVCVGLGAHLRGGFSVWQRVEATEERLQRERVALERLERDLANAIVYDDRAASYGDAEGQLPRLQLEDAILAWVTVASTRQPLTPSVRWVTYRCAELGGVQGLWRTSQPIGEARLRREVVPELLLPGCRQLSVRYAVFPDDASETIEWRSRWDAPEQTLPRLLEVTMQVGQGHSVTRMFLIPIGVNTPAGPSL